MFKWLIDMELLFWMFRLSSHVELLLDVTTLDVAKRLTGGRYIKEATQRDHAY